MEPQPFARSLEEIIREGRPGGPAGEREQAPPPPPPPPAEAEALRRTLIGDEATVLSLGTLDLVGAGGVLALVGVELAKLPSLATMEQRFECVGAAIGLAVWAAGSLALGLGLRRLRPWARSVQIVLSFFQLLAFPMGTVAGLVGLRVLLSKRGAILFTPEYAQLRAATPQVRYRTPRWLKLLVGVALGLLLGVALLAWLARR